MLIGYNGVGRGQGVVLGIAGDVEGGTGSPGYEGERGDEGYLIVSEWSYICCLDAKSRHKSEGREIINSPE